MANDKQATPVQPKSVGYALGPNVQVIDETDDFLMIRITKSDLGESGSGKNITLATTSGNRQTAKPFNGRAVKIGVNVFSDNPAYGPDHPKYAANQEKSKAIYGARG